MVLGKSGPEQILHRRSLTGVEWLQWLQDQYPDDDPVISDSIREKYQQTVEKFEQLGASPSTSQELYAGPRYVLTVVIVVIMVIVVAMVTVVIMDTVVTIVLVAICNHYYEL